MLFPPHLELQAILTTHIEAFLPLGLRALILFGSFVRGEEREDSDVDICLIFENLEGDKRKTIWDLERKNENLYFERKIDRIIVSREDFQNETAPIYTSIKNTGKILFGEEVAKMFLYLFELNEKEWNVTKEECLLGLEYAKKILSLYEREI